jgi:hypothetical protein
MTPAEERQAWQHHNLEQLQQWRDLTFRQKLQSLEDMGEFARHVEAMRRRPVGQPLGETRAPVTSTGSSEQS